jgi:hypothetical protein
MGMSNSEPKKNGFIVSSEVLEQKLLSFGALGAISTVRKSFPDTVGVIKRFDQHHDNDMDIPEKYRSMMSYKANIGVS